MKRLSLILLLVLLARPVLAQERHTIQLSDTDIENLLSAGAQCLDKVPYACAAYAMFVRNMLLEARKPKTPAAPAPDPPK